MKIKKPSNLQINGKLYLENRGGTLVLGNGCIINSGVKHNPIGGNEKTIIVIEKNAKINIGNHVGMSNTAIFSAKYVKIDDDVMIGGGVCIYDTDFHSLDFSKRISGHDEDYVCKPVHIHEGVFIGAHSIILKGVEIGRYSIIGAGSVVTRSVPANEVWAGNPARFIRKLEERKL